MVEASKKARVYEALIREKMDLTFSLRRREVVEDQALVVEIQNRGPALFFKDQVRIYVFFFYSRNYNSCTLSFPCL